MSVIAFANQMKAREDAAPDSIKDEKAQPLATKDYVIVLAGLVPAEALALHAAAIAVTTGMAAHGAGTVITDQSTLEWSFWGLVALTVFLYVSVHLRTWDPFDFGRVLIPPAAFVAWSMVQRPSAFDAVFGSDISWPGRSMIAAFAAVVLAVFAKALVSKADQKA